MAPTEFCTSHTAETTVTVCLDCPILDGNGEETGLYHLAGEFCPEESRQEVSLLGYQREDVGGAGAEDAKYFLGVTQEAGPVRSTLRPSPTRICPLIPTSHGTPVIRGIPTPTHWIPQGRAAGVPPTLDRRTRTRLRAERRRTPAGRTLSSTRRQGGPTDIEQKTGPRSIAPRARFSFCKQSGSHMPKTRGSRLLSLYFT